MAVIDVVGKEGLPNLYIDRVEAALATPTGTYLSHHKLRITLACFDSKTRSWFNRPELLNMKIKIVAIHDHNNHNYKVRRDALDSGLLNLFGYKSDTTEFKVKVYPAPSNISDEGSNFDKFSIVANIDVPAIQGPERADAIITSELTIYAALFIDNLAFDNDVFNKFYGPMVSEVILKAGAPNTIAQYFYFPDTNEEYGGPVHNHEGTWMEGSKHTDEPHRKLRMVTMSNYKLEIEEI